MDPAGRSASLYYALPWPLQNAILTAFGWQRARVRFGRSFREQLEFLRDSDTWDATRIRRYQDDQVAAIVEKAYRETAYYREVMDERRLRPDDITGVEDLPKLPILTKDDIRRHRDRIVAASADRRKLHTIQTSGSSGPPMRILTPRRGLASKWAVWWRHRERFGMQRGMRYASVMSTPWVRPDRDRPPYWRWNRIENQAFVPMQQIVPSKIGDVARFLDEGGFRFWSGYPSILHALVTIADDAGLEMEHPPDVIFTGAEALFDHQRRDLAAFTGARVSQMYGFNEAAGNASECEDGSLHEDFEFGYMECVDPQVDADTGNRRASIIATAFANDAMPLIRYEVGDVGVWRPDGYRCPCGRASRVLAAVDGRLEDYVVTPEGLRVRRIGDIFKDLPALRRFQVVQQRPEEITIRLVVTDGFDRQANEDLLAKRVERWISDTIALRFEYPDAIAPGPTGKLERVVGLVRDE